MTGLNPNVVYELALRHSFNKISVHLIDNAADIPFDLKDERTIVLNLADPASVDSCKKVLLRIIKEISAPKFVYTSPTFRVLGVAAATDKEKENFLESLADQMSSIASDVSSIEMDVGSIESDVSNISSIESAVSQIEKAVQRTEDRLQAIMDKLEIAGE